MLFSITISVLLIIFCIVITEKISFLNNADKKTEAYSYEVHIEDDNLNETENAILNILINTTFTSNFQSTMIRESYYEYLKSYLESANVQLGSETLNQLEDKMKDIAAIMSLEKEHDIKNMPINSREIVLNITKQIYKTCGLKLVYKLQGDIQKVSDMNGNYFYFSESLFEQEFFDSTVFLSFLAVVLFLFNICLCIAKKNHLFIKEEIYDNQFIKKNSPNKYLLVLDLGCILLSFFITTWIRYGGITRYWGRIMYGIAFIFILLLYIAIYYAYDTYSRIFKRGFLEELTSIIKINCLLAVTLTFIMFVFQEGTTYSRYFFFNFFTLNILINYITRLYFKFFLLAVYKKSGSSNKLMIITTSDKAKEVLDRIKKENDWEYQVTYLTILDRQLMGQWIEGIPVKANLINMYEVARQEVVDEVFIYLPSDSSLSIDLDETILEFVNMGITVNLSINTFGLKVREKIVREISGYYSLSFSTRLIKESQKHLKRIMDIVGGIVGCILTLVLIVFLAPVIKLESPGPIFFSQVRVGKNGRRFKIYKFRSMYIDAEKRKEELMNQNEMNGFMFKMKDDPRVTKVGKFLRKTSLDEFPQFFNILKGEMSLVGTRPPTEDEFLRYEGRYKRRLALKCGLTGLWQVSGRSDIQDFEEVVKLDLEYIDNWSFKLDLKILLKTVVVVLFGRGSR